MTTTHALPLPGLSALDPLGYLAALGCLLATTDACDRRGAPRPTLRFEPGSHPVPVLHGPWPDVDELVQVLLADLERLAGREPDGPPRDAFLAFAYDDDKGKPVHDLKPPPEVFRSFAQTLVDHGRPDDRRTLDWLSAVLTDVAVDGSGAAKPFALHFTAGQQRFGTVTLELLDGNAKAKPGSPGRPVDAEDLRAAVLGPWPEDRTLKVFGWSPTQDRAYALRAVDPSGDTKLGTPGADWLALRGIGMLSSAPVGDSIVTSGVRGRWKSGTWSYPVWPMRATVEVVRSLLRHPAVGRDGGRGGGTLPRGVEVLTCRISRSDQGGYGALSRPARG
ncbi:MAG: hypothetical protein AB1Z98_33655 [Nannocystaceae bacterium]